MIKYNKKNKFTINFKKPRHGWLPFVFLNGKNPMIYISSSGVFNPFYDYVDILYDLKYNRKKKIEFFIDQEGYDAKITFINRGLYVLIETETLSKSKRRKHLKKSKAIFLKKQVIFEMKIKLSNLFRENKQEMCNWIYNFEFNKGKLYRI